MDVNKKFILQLAILGSIVLILSVLVFISATRDPITSSPSTPPPNVSLGDFSIDESLEQEQESGDTRQRLGSLIIEDTIPPALQVQAGKTALLDTNEVAYQVNMRVLWSEQLHTPFYTEDAHLSPVILWTHKANDPLFKVGAVASDSIQSLVTTDAVDGVREELNRYAGQVLDIALFEDSATLTNQTTSITFSEQARNLSLVSKLIPSSDWFVSIHNLPLYENGKWHDYKEVDAVIYDAGVYEGSSFTAGQEATTPQDRIQKLGNTPLVPIVSFEFIQL